jgi:hypothetical protein
MKQDGSYFEGQDSVLIFIARKLREAMKLEAAFTEAGIEYAVETGEFKGGVIFPSTLIGAFFYVLPSAAEAARATMRARGFKPYSDPSIPQ